jgi:hypothetical protein
MVGRSGKGIGWLAGAENGVGWRENQSFYDIGPIDVGVRSDNLSLLRLDIKTVRSQPILFG